MLAILLILALCAHGQEGPGNGPSPWDEPEAETSTEATPAPDKGTQPEPPTLPFALKTPGHDSEHADKVKAELLKIFTNEALLERVPAACRRVVDESIEVTVAFDPATGLSAVLLTKQPLPALDIYPGGKRIDAGCSLGIADWLHQATRANQVTIVHMSEKGGVALSWLGSSLGRRTGPPAVELLLPPDKVVRVPNYGKSGMTLLFEFPGKLPNGDPNPSALLAEVVGVRERE